MAVIRNGIKQIFNDRFGFINLLKILVRLPCGLSGRRAASQEILYLRGSMEGDAGIVLQPSKSIFYHELDCFDISGIL